MFGRGFDHPFYGCLWSERPQSSPFTIISSCLALFEAAWRQGVLKLYVGGKPMGKQPVYKERTIDSTIGLVRSPYLFISDRLRGYDAEAFDTRILLKKTICWQGKEAAKIFYDSNNLPARVRRRKEY